MYVINLRRSGCLTTVSLNDVTIVTPELPYETSLSSSCALAIRPGLNVVRVASWIPGEPEGATGRVEIEFERVERTAQGSNSVSVLAIDQAVEARGTTMTESNFPALEAPALALWAADRIERFDRDSMEPAIGLARRLSQALQAGRHDEAVALSELRFADMSTAFATPRERMVDIFERGFREVGPMRAIEFDSEAVRPVIEADQRLFTLVREGGRPLLGFLTPQGVRRVPIGVSRVGGEWVVSR